MGLGDWVLAKSAARKIDTITSNLYESIILSILKFVGQTNDA